jgi:Protein of unknown function DUF262
MKVSTVLDHIDSGHMALPEFQRGYVWNSDQVRKLFTSLYLRRPVGGLLVWATESKTATHRGDEPLPAGVVKLLLDGQQRMTSLYGGARGKPPRFFDGNANAFTGLRFNLDTETFEFYQPVKMRDDPLWIDVTELMKRGTGGLGEFVARLSAQPALATNVGEYVGRLSRLLGITDVDLHVEEVTGTDKTLDVVVDIFNQVNSGGTKLSKGDLALAKICADWPEGRDTMKAKLKEWVRADYRFSLDWLLRSMNTVLTGEAKFQFLHDKTAEEIQDGLKRAAKHPGGGITTQEEEEQLEALNDWMEEQGLPPGVLAYDFADVDTGEQKAVFDLAWPNGIQEELSQPVAVLLNEGTDTIAIASHAGYRCFTTDSEFRRYVQAEILVEQAGA